MMKKCSSIKSGGGGLKRTKSQDITPDQTKLNINLIEKLQSDTPSIQEIQKLLEQGADPNIKHPFLNSYTTITNVIKTKDGPEILKLLLEYGLDANLQDIQGYDNGDTLLHFVIGLKNFNLVKLIVKHDGLINLGNNNKETPLIKAVKKKDIEIINYLLQKDAEPNELTLSHLTALHIASVNNLIDITKLLIRYNADVNIGDSHGLTPVIYAISKNNTEIIKMLLPHCNAETIAMALEYVFTKRDLNMTKLLVEDDTFDLIYDNQELLLHTMKLIFEQFLQTFSDYDLHIIKWLISYMGKYTFDTLMENEPNVLTELMYIYSSDVDKIEFLINLGAKVENIHPETGDTSLIVSAKNPYTNIEIVKCLLNHLTTSKSTYINHENNQGETALILFVNFSDNIIKYLLDNGGDINYKNKYGETFFMYACKSSIDITYLIKHGANINNQSLNGETSLMWAIKDENETNVKLLLDNNANIKLETIEHKNAYQIALELNNSTILRLLSEHILENNIDINPRYYKYITKYTSDNRFNWKDACKTRDRYEVQKYKDILHIDDSGVEEVCEKLDSYEKELFNIKEQNITKCVNSDNLDGNDVNDIYPENFYMYQENGITYCEDIRTLFKLLKSFKKRQPPKPAENPYTGKPLSDTIIKDIEEKYKIYNTISTGKQIEEIITPTTPSSKDILSGQISFFYNIMKQLSNKEIFLNSHINTLDSFIQYLKDIQVHGNLIFTDAELQKVKNDDLNKYKYQTIQLLLSKVLADKYKYIEGEQIIYPTREAIQQIWNKIFK
jgi:ankyrin repeat protein